MNILAILFPLIIGALLYPLMPIKVDEYMSSDEKKNINETRKAFEFKDELLYNAIFLIATGTTCSANLHGVLNFMKIYGYTEINPDALEEMKEISLQSSPAILREIAKFLVAAANKIDSKDDKSPDHFHLRDYVAIWSDNFPDIIVINSNIYSEDTGG